MENLLQSFQLETTGQVQTLVLGLIAFATLILVGFFSFVTYVNRKYGSKAALKGIPGSLTINPESPATKTQITELLALHGLNDSFTEVGQMIRQKAARLKTAVLTLPPKEVVECLYCGDLAGAKQMLLNNCEGGHQALYFWAVADISFIQIDFPTALYYLDRAYRLEPEHQDIKEDLKRLVRLWESRKHKEPAPATT